MEMYKIKKRLEAKTNPNNTDETDMYLYGYVTDDKWWDDEECVATKDIREQLLQIKTGIINLHINSPGGSAFDGIAISNLLKQHSAKINVYIDGMAASAASVIAMAGDKIYMPANAMMMIHRAASFAWGNAEDLRNEAESLEKLDAAVFTSYAGRFVGTETELKALIDKETYLTAEEALAFGFCDEVLKDRQTEQENSIPAKEKLFAKYNKNVPEKPHQSMKLSDCMLAFFNGIGGNEE